MVYNTTDNRSSLSITDLTSDGEYSVTVAGKDEAGRLGEESQDLKINKDSTQQVLFSYNAQKRTIIVKWKVNFCITLTN